MKTFYCNFFLLLYTDVKAEVSNKKNLVVSSLPYYERKIGCLNKSFLMSCFLKHNTCKCRGSTIIHHVKSEVPKIFFLCDHVLKHTSILEAEVSKEENTL